MFPITQIKLGNRGNPVSACLHSGVFINLRLSQRKFASLQNEWTNIMYTFTQMQNLVSRVRLCQYIFVNYCFFSCESHSLYEQGVFFFCTGCCLPLYVLLCSFYLHT